MFSQTVEYALRAIVHLAYHVEEPQTAQAIAAGTLVPLPYLSKVLQNLARAGLIHGQRGRHGGFTLRSTPDQLSVFDVIQAVDPIQRITTCPLGLKQHGVDLCPLHRRLDNAMKLAEQSFRQSNIAELISEPTSSKPLCAFPTPTVSESD